MYRQCESIKKAVYWVTHRNIAHEGDEYLQTDYGMFSYFILLRIRKRSRIRHI